MPEFDLPLSYLSAAGAILLILLIFARGRSAPSRGFSQALAMGWAEVDVQIIRDYLRDFPPLHRKGAKLVFGGRKTIRGMEAMVCRYSAPAGEHSQPATDDIWLIVPMPGQAPTATIQPRKGGAVEKAFLAIAAAAGLQTLDPGPTWAWAMVFTAEPSHWFSRTRGEALQRILGPSRGLHTHRRAAVLTVSASKFPTLIRDADQLVDDLFRAVAH